MISGLLLQQAFKTLEIKSIARPYFYTRLIIP